MQVSQFYFLILYFSIRPRRMISLPKSRSFSATKTPTVIQSKPNTSSPSTSLPRCADSKPNTKMGASSRKSSRKRIKPNKSSGKLFVRENKPIYPKP